MTLVGKIFTVFIFGMSILFMAFSVAVFATHRNWKQEILQSSAEGDPGYRERLSTAYNRITDLQGELERAQTTLAHERAARRHALAELRTRLDVAQEELASRENDLAARSAALDQATEALRTQQNTLAKYKTEVEELRDDIRVVRENISEKHLQALALSNQLMEMENNRQRLSERNEQLVVDVADLERVLAAHGLTRHDDLPPPSVEGIVTAVSERNVEISIGSDDGLQTGHELVVFRNNRYLGRVIIRRTSPDRSVGEILPATQQAPIQRGDRVATRVI